MPTNRRKRTRKMRRPAPLTPGQLSYLATGVEPDFSAFKLSGDMAAVRKAFESVRGQYKRGAFPWAEAQFGERPRRD